jgi:DNA-directed RNA polymerase alpha subunit
MSKEAMLKAGHKAIEEMIERIDSAYADVESDIRQKVAELLVLQEKSLTLEQQRDGLQMALCASINEARVNLPGALA